MEFTPLQIVYVLTNPAMPNLVKIGKTTRESIDNRLVELYSTGVPVPFECVYAAKVPNASIVEKALHIAFGPYRVNAKREFFSINPEQAIEILKLLNLEEITADVEAAEEAVIDDQSMEAGKQLGRSRRSNFTFSRLGIASGSELSFTESDCKAVVTGDKRVSYEGRDWSLTELTKKLLNLSYSVQPTPYWTYNGQILKNIYENLYSGQADIETM